MISPAEAEQLLRAQVTPWPSEPCPLLGAHGRVLRADVRADRDLPPFDRVTMDGYALRAAAIARGVRRFRIEAIQPAGAPAARLGESDDACVEVMTGAVLPVGADAVVPYEDTTRTDRAVDVRDDFAVSAGNAVHGRGSDYRAGDAVLRAGCRITGREIAIAATVGAATLEVAALPRIALIASGDELVDVDAAVAPHQIRRSNDHALRAALQMAGYARVESFHLRDLRQEIDALLARVLAAADVVILTGGVSKGKYDLLPAALEAHGVQKLFHGVAQRPGKPLWCGRSARGSWVFALPGNPVSSYTCLHRYVLPTLDQASGLAEPGASFAALTEPVRGPAGLTLFLPVQVAVTVDARLVATPRPTNTSGDLAGLSGTNGFVELPPRGDGYPAGHVARFFAW